MSFLNHQPIKKQKMRKSDFNPANNFPKGQNGGGRKPVAIELWNDGQLVKWFPTLTKAAQWLGTTQGSVSMTMKRGHKVRGFTIKRSEPIDVILRQIAEENKKPYQFSKRI